VAELQQFKELIFGANCHLRFDHKWILTIQWPQMSHCTPAYQVTAQLGKAWLSYWQCRQVYRFIYLEVISQHWLLKAG